MNSMEPPGSAVMSQIARRRCGRVGQPGSEVGWTCMGPRRVWVSMLVRKRGCFVSQKIPLMMQDAHGPIYRKTNTRFTLITRHILFQQQNESLKLVELMIKSNSQFCRIASLIFTIFVILIQRISCKSVKKNWDIYYHQLKRLLDLSEVDCTAISPLVS